MARPFEFDYNTTIEKGARVFWKTGSASTSLRDLLKGMKIGEGSFYNTFKSKKNAYLECLKHYNATVNREHGEAFFFGPNAALGDTGDV
jgi:TetR/AcrR family transcriptional repressor of nem operon